MSNNWIYVGADRSKHQWSKVGKTTVGLHTRHTSSQSPDYFIYTAYNILMGDIHDIESELLTYLENHSGFLRLEHFSTGTKSECFDAHPQDVTELVESFLVTRYPRSVNEESLTGDIICYQCEDFVYREFNRNQTPSPEIPWEDEESPPPPSNLKRTASSYYAGNQIEYEVGLGSGYFLDHASGLQGYRDEEGNEYFNEPK